MTKELALQMLQDALQAWLEECEGDFEVLESLKRLCSMAKDEPEKILEVLETQREKYKRDLVDKHLICPDCGQELQEFETVENRGEYWGSPCNYVQRFMACPSCGWGR